MSRRGAGSSTRRKLQRDVGVGHIAVAAAAKAGGSAARQHRTVQGRVLHTVRAFFSGAKTGCRTSEPGVARQAQEV